MPKTAKFKMLQAWFDEACPWMVVFKYKPPAQADYNT